MQSWVKFRTQGKNDENVAQSIVAFGWKRQWERKRDKNTLQRTNIKYEKWLLFELHFIQDKDRVRQNACISFMSTREIQSKWHTSTALTHKPRMWIEIEQITENSHSAPFNWRWNVICLSFYCVYTFSSYVFFCWFRITVIYAAICFGGGRYCWCCFISFHFGFSRVYFMGKSLNDWNFCALSHLLSALCTIYSRKLLHFPI